MTNVLLLSFLLFLFTTVTDITLEDLPTACVLTEAVTVQCPSFFSVAILCDGEGSQSGRVPNSAITFSYQQFNVGIQVVGNPARSTLRVTLNSLPTPAYGDLSFIPPILPAYSGVYQCQVTTPVGRAVSNFTLTVTGKWVAIMFSSIAHLDRIYNN